MANEDLVEETFCLECGYPLGKDHAPNCSVGEPKIPPKYAGRPEPVTNRRFEATSNPKVEEKLHACRESLREIQQGYPEVAGLTIFGSSVTGRANDESDIDCCLFFDLHTIFQINPGVRIATQTFKSDSGVILTNTTLESEEDRRKYLLEFYNLVASHLSADTKNPIEHASFFVVGKEIIDFHINEWLAFAQNATECVKKTMSYDNFIERGGDSQKAPEALQPPQRLEIAANLVSIFHLQIGHGLDEYRKHIIERLENEGQLGATCRNAIIRSAEAIEQYSTLGTEKRYPRTLGEARKTYIRREK